MHIALPTWPALPAFLRPSPATRIATGLVSLMISLLLISDVFVGGLLPDRNADARQHRQLAAELVATQVAHALANSGDAQLRALLHNALRADRALASAAILTGAQTRAIAGDHAHQWTLVPDEASTFDNVRVPLLAEGRRLGELQLAFVPSAPGSLLGWASQPGVLGIALVAMLGLVSFQLYLRRAMRYLDPSAAVPERVRTAFDTLTEGVLVLDTEGRVMLANRAFCALGGAAAGVPIGTAAHELPWLVAALTPEVGVPWQRAIQTNQPVLGLELTFGGGTDNLHQAVMNCSPINDGAKRARGCLVTFADVTELHNSREEIRRKNEELTMLATRDGLTGCLNRRAFMLEAERALAAALESGTPLCCVMCDVDHFKSVNDRFGHGGGDEVLKAVSKALGRGLRTGDLLGRYGGEEFCIVLPDATLEQARQIAERLRADVEAHAGMAVRQFADVKITMSFGVEQLGPEAAQFTPLCDRADQALYHSKKSGRNRVTAWDQVPAEVVG